MIKKDRAILFSVLLLLIVTYNLWPRLWPGAFYHGIAASFLLIFIFLRRISKKEPFLHATATILMWLALNNVLDEIFFDPRTFGINEYIVAAIVIFITYRKVWKEWKTKTRKGRR